MSDEHDVHKRSLPPITWEKHVAAVLIVLFVGICMMSLGMPHMKRLAYHCGGTLFVYCPDSNGLRVPLLSEQPFLGMVRLFLIMIGPALFASLSVANRMHPLVILFAAIIFTQVATLYSVTIDWERGNLWMSFQTFYSWLVFALLAAGVSAYIRRDWRT